jgi:hypothetical protein
MNPEVPAPAHPGPPAAAPRGWMVVAVAAVTVQVLGFWMVSPADHAPKRATPPPARQAFLDVTPDGDTDGGADGWLWLLSPSVFFQPSERDFSGAAWLAGTPVRVEIEAFSVPQRPLPFEGAIVPGEATRLAGGTRGPLSRVDPGPGSRWEVTEGLPRSPVSTPVPLPAESRLRVVSGLAGWRLRSPPAWPSPAEASAGIPPIVRVVLGPDGEPATPPTLWESSGVAALDEAAVEVVRRLRWAHADRPAPPDPWTASGSDWSWGLLEIRWGSGPPAP